MPRFCFMACDDVFHKSVRLPFLDFFMDDITIIQLTFKEF
ncbi:hypothetical protein C427_5460 [Paraglaciecola psychrophila 170]|uniref:Uncharacterized protein n=1 Tax=Paraglaciecola psychrophila 170 TaxID=1129794 RepID=K7AY29_9ALTE|nr:hypothetical protein C427_5460 [Paraglaciecola psychrophila 170]GAC40015.1 hypothetical protein GPSY_4412 [Paraglaciecola psychrophila 170]